MKNYITKRADQGVQQGIKKVIIEAKGEKNKLRPQTEPKPELDSVGKEGQIIQIGSLKVKLRPLG